MDGKEEYNPFVERNVKHPTTDFETFVHLVKGSLGAGILAMPYAFRNIGLWAGIGGIIFVCVICTYCLHMLVDCAHTLCRRHRIPKLSYPGTAEKCFLDEEGKLTKMSIIARDTVTLFIIVDVLGCICIYLVTVSSNLVQVFDFYFPGHVNGISIWILVIACTLIPLSLIRNLKFLAPFSLIANILIFLSLIIMFVFIFSDMPNVKNAEAVADVKHWPTFFGTSIFALECVAVVMSLENDMKTPRHFIGCPSVLVLAMSVVSTLYTILGFFGYLKFGLDVEANISLNMPINNPWAQAVKGMVAVAIYFTILLNLAVAIELLWSMLKENVPKGKEITYENILRISIIMYCALIAAIFPHLGPFLSLIGAVCMSTLGLFLPALFDLVVYRKDPGYGFLKNRLIKNIIIIVFSVIGCLAGTIESLKQFREQNIRLNTKI